jgi:hypothetical protein
VYVLDVDTEQRIGDDGRQCRVREIGVDDEH